DLTNAPAAEPSLASKGGEAGLETGGAGAFLHLLDQVIRPHLARHYPIDETRLTLFGHSLGGYFVLRTLLTAPASFRGYVAASPSIWWDRRGLLESVGTLADRLPRQAPPRRVMVTAGEYEEKLSPTEVGGRTDIAERRDARAMVSNVLALGERLAHVPGGRLITHHEVFPAEDHASSVLRTINIMLRFVLSETSAG